MQFSFAQAGRAAAGDSGFWAANPSCSRSVLKTVKAFLSPACPLALLVVTFTWLWCFAGTRWLPGATGITFARHVHLPASARVVGAHCAVVHGGKIRATNFGGPYPGVGPGANAFAGVAPDALAAWCWELARRTASPGTYSLHVAIPGGRYKQVFVMGGLPSLPVGPPPIP